jgi:predicted transposase/invertase (TIGR01784 family)
MKETIELLDPKSDIVFKAIFSQDNELAHGARNSLISSFIGKKVVQSIVIENEPAQTNVHAKKVRLDLHCVLDDKSQIIVEMQSKPTADDIVARVLYYLSRCFGNQKISGFYYKDLKPVYLIVIMDFTHFDFKQYISKFVFANLETKTVLSELLQIHFLELKKIRKTSKMQLEMDALLQWSYFFKNKGTHTLEKTTEIDKGVIMAETLLSRISQDEIQRIKIMREELAEVDYYSGLRAAEEQGLARGRSEGLEQGLEQGSHNAFIKTARSMNAEGLSPEQIKRFTGLSEGEY